MNKYCILCCHLQAEKQGIQRRKVYHPHSSPGNELLPPVLVHTAALEPQPDLCVQMNKTPTDEWEAVSSTARDLALSQLGVTFDFLQV